MLYKSTRGITAPVTFRDAVMMGLANDGGLLLPDYIPDARNQLDQWRGLTYPELAFEIMSLFVGHDIPPDALRTLIQRSYQTFDDPEIAPTLEVGPLHICELFHGPTLAFKDIALQFLGNLFEYILAASDASLNIIGATSGDTGSAAIYGVRGKKNIQIFIMFPKGKVSPVQERQMTTVPDANVHTIAIEGSFDDAQQLLKELFNDLEFKAAYRLGAVNSVNWARVLAQIVYYFHAAFQVQKRTGAELTQFAVPTGNFGDIFAGYLAARMGAPIQRLILATNENDILTRFFNTGVYRKGPVHTTLSPSMDIQIASNFERYLYYRLNQEPAQIRKLMHDFQNSGQLQLPGNDPLIIAGTGTTQDTLDTIAYFHREYDYLLDPHTAVGVAVAKRLQLPDTPTICLATAHPAKFPEAIQQATGENVAHHHTIDGILDKPARCHVLPAQKDDIKNYVIKHTQP